MEDFIFSPRAKPKPNTVAEPSFFTIYGSHDFLDDNGNPRLNSHSKNVLAKINPTSDNNLIYSLKVGANGRIFNPMGLFSEGKQQKFLSKIGKNEFNFQKVNKKVFDLYLNFLRTKNLAWLNNAEREMI